MKVDFHSHILPGIDDGAKTLEESVQLVGSMASWGFERITCTPHITRLYRNTPDIIRKEFDRLSEALYVNGIGVELRMSAEYRLNPETWPDVLAKGWLMPIEDKYILMEFPISHRSEMGDLDPMEEFKKVMALGLTPILPHPERYFYLSHDEMIGYIDAGVRIQSNYGSLAGLYGLESQYRAQNLLDEGVVSFLATDMHNLKYVEIIGEWFAQGHKIAEF